MKPRHKNKRKRGDRNYGERRKDRPGGEKPFKNRARASEKPRETAVFAGEKPSLYGFHAVRAAWLNPAREIRALYLTDNAEKGFEETLTEGRQKGLHRPAITKIDKSALDRMLPRDAVHQGLALSASPLEEVFIQDLIIRSSGEPKPVFLMLDQVTDPHNVGAILRSACAFGASGVIMQRMHAPELEGVLAKTASGAVEHMPVAFETNLSRAIEEMKEAGFFVCGLDESGEKMIRDMPDGKAVIVLGAEGSGLRRLVKENCDALYRLPTAGPIQSLNVSNAAAVALYAIAGSRP